ncbi:hypothetical protein DUI87_32050 [Hirundo rustica rustica]|uniref:Uncharacterized protein n=1 Tax=Hirundo rustica rustica TaxID=333673 RepID=A0A3M0IPU7_HIRRU|nr:hypothetical protein DUI87_32050 [Hirundo rustica rustica]
MRAAGLLLAWALLRPAAGQQCHPASSPGGVLRFTDRHAEIQVPALQHRVPSSLDPLYGLVRRCLDLIQQNPLPTGGAVRAGLCRLCRRGSALLHRGRAGGRDVLLYYCRSRRRCGGRLRAHRRSLGCRRRCLLACLSFTSLIILISVTCAFVTSQRVKGQMEPGLGAVPSTLRTLRQHLANVPQMVVDKFEVPRKQIVSDLGGKQGTGQHPELAPGMDDVLTVPRCLAGLSRSVGLSIHAQLKAMTYAALADLQDRAGDLAAHHLQILHRTVRALAAARAELEPALRERRHRVVELLDDPRCTSCASVLGRAQGLELGADYGKVPSVEKVLKALAGLPRSDFAEMIRQGNGTFNSIPELAVERMAQFIDTPGNLPPSMNLTRQLNLRRDSNLSSTYRTRPISKKRLSDFTANLGDVRLLRSEGRQDLETFARSGLDEVDYGRFQEEAKLGESVQFLSHLAPHLKERVKRTLATTASVEARLPVQAQQILRQELGCFTRKELRYFTHIPQLGRADAEGGCGFVRQPLATALDNGRVILCDRIADPWNAFWFSLGCCTFFLIPNIIFAVRLTNTSAPSATGSCEKIKSDEDELDNDSSPQAKQGFMINLQSHPHKGTLSLLNYLY